MIVMNFSIPFIFDFLARDICCTCNCRFTLTSTYHRNTKVKCFCHLFKLLSFFYLFSGKGKSRQVIFCIFSYLLYPYVFIKFWIFKDLLKSLSFSKGAIIHPKGCFAFCEAFCPCRELLKKLWFFILSTLSLFHLPYLSHLSFLHRLVCILLCE